LFERFHRVENTRGRTHEGTGIGLALVQELVKLPLSRAAGKVSIKWAIDELVCGNSAKLNMSWTERGGPRVDQPASRGFGTRLIETGADQLDAEVSLDFAPEGFRCRMVFPVAEEKPHQPAHGAFL
jgi:hypothetical protein